MISCFFVFLRMVIYVRYIKIKIRGDIFKIWLCFDIVDYEMLRFKFECLYIVDFCCCDGR